ncbi:MAG: hypothetical protein NXH90_15700 [Flavobacteriaceae bacterium]|nr:hypothetical protein [Flavobacteriaceae bacterium]
MRSKKIYFNNLHLYDLHGKQYEVFQPKKIFIEVRLNQLESLGTISKHQDFFDHWGVSYIMNSFVGLMYCNPDFTMDDIVRQFDILDRKLSIPQWVKNEILMELATIMKEGLVEDTIKLMLQDDKAIKQVTLERAWIIDPLIELDTDEYNVLTGKAKHEFTMSKRLGQLRTLLLNWDSEKYGKPTNENLAKLIDISEPTIARSYSPLLKEEKAMAKKGIKKLVQPRPRDEEKFRYDINGVEYNKYYLLKTNNKIYFPLMGNYTVNNFGEICKKNSIGEFKPMSLDNQGLCQLTIDGKRYKINPEKAMVDELFKEMLKPKRKELLPNENLFSLDKKQLKENIKEFSKLSGNNNDEDTEQDKKAA